MIVRGITAVCVATAMFGTGIGEAHGPQSDHGHAPAVVAKPEARPARTPEPRTNVPVESKAAPATMPNKAQPATPAPAPEPVSAPTNEPDATRTADEALALLIEGNSRWIKGRVESPNSSPDRRRATAEQGQKPFVTVLSCSDSRVPVEEVFDRGVGEIFTVRVAGSVVGDHEIGTIEYGVGHLHTPLVLVMGHSKCGAVGAAVTEADVHGRVRGLIECIRPSVERARKLNPTLSGDELVAAAVRENVWQSVFELLKSSEEVREGVMHAKVRVVGAVYDLATGRVEVLGEHPWQSQLLGALATPARPGETASEGASEDAKR